jgi:hypothetical protein
MPKENQIPKTDPIRVPSKEDIQKIFWEDKNRDQSGYDDPEEGDMIPKKKPADSNPYGDDE